MRQHDPYRVLGVGTDATGAEITRAYRRLARAVHPDSRPGDPAAAAEFQAVADAYGLLSDSARRAAWDHEHRARQDRRLASRGAPAAAGPPPWLLLSVTAPWQGPEPVRGAALRAGPVRIEPADPPGDSDQRPAADPASLAWLAYLLLADRRQRPW